MRKKIDLVGCGNVGSRHLQALMKLSFSTKIRIVEPNKKSQELAKLRLNEFQYDKKLHELSWHESIKDLDNQSDLVIVATPSVNRVEQVRELSEKGNSRFLIEKMVCQSTEDYDQLLELMKKTNGKSWVNTTRRYFESYKKIKAFFSKSNYIFLNVIAGNQGLGSNALHYLDLFSWFCEDYKISLNGNFLHEKIFKNKRGEHFVEFAGSIFGSSSGGSVIGINFLPYDSLPTIINVVSESIHLMIDETNEKLIILKGPTEFDKLKFQNEFVSNATTKIVEDIINTENCYLPTLENSHFAHQELFRIFNTHLKKMTNKEIKLCPIT